VVVDPADSLDTALLPLGDARVPAFLPDACKVDGTLGVRGAFRWDWFSNRRADLICISFVPRWADASRPMVSDLT
jgi:hypothetical protein